MSSYSSSIMTTSSTSTSPSGTLNELPSAYAAPGLLDASADCAHEMHVPLLAYLAAKYPDHSDDVLHFIATRLLSRDCPHRHDGDWVPLGPAEGAVICGCSAVLSTKPNGTKSDPHHHHHVHKRIEKLVVVAHRSYALLEMECPDEGKL